MGNRCECSGKFVTLELEGPNELLVEIDDDGSIEATFELTLSCEDCGTGMETG